MKSKYILLALLISFLPTTFSIANIETYSFSSLEQETRYQEMLRELRCLVCQNQSLADSNADLAQDLRNKTYKMITAGHSDKEIRDFMVTRYGDFITYRPPFNRSTFALWTSPGLLLILGIVIIYRITRQSHPVNKRYNSVKKTQIRKMLRGESEQ